MMEDGSSKTKGSDAAELDEVIIDDPPPSAITNYEYAVDRMIHARTSRDLDALKVEYARKQQRVAQLEVVKSKLRETGKNWIEYPEYVNICREGFSEEGLQIAKLLDECGTVIVLGDVVNLWPEQVAKVHGDLIPLAGAANPNDPRRKELEELERQKAAIDKIANSQVRLELWGGLAFLAVLIAACIRLTFWELSWDVMEPICFYMRSMYFMAGYTFFLLTSKEPSFEGFHQSRFSSKQKKLMKMQKFDVQKYNELKSEFYPNSFDQYEKMQIGAV